MIQETNMSGFTGIDNRFLNTSDVLEANSTLVTVSSTLEFNASSAISRRLGVRCVANNSAGSSEHTLNHTTAG